MAERKTFWLAVSYPVEDRPDDVMDPESSWGHYVLPAVAAIGGFSESMPCMVEGMSVDCIHIEPPGAHNIRTVEEILEQALDHCRMAQGKSVG